MEFEKFEEFIRNLKEFYERESLLRTQFGVNISESFTSYLELALENVLDEIYPEDFSPIYDFIFSSLGEELLQEDIEDLYNELENAN